MLFNLETERGQKEQTQTYMDVNGIVYIMAMVMTDCCFTTFIDRSKIAGELTNRLNVLAS